MSISILENGRIVDRRNGDLSIFAGGEISVCYTLHTDNIKEGKRVSSTPYVDRTDDLVTKNGVRYGENTKSTVKIEPYEDGIVIEAAAEGEGISEYGINLPFNFMGKKNGKCTIVSVCKDLGEIIYD